MIPVAEWFGIGLLGGSLAWLTALELLRRWADRLVFGNARYPHGLRED